MRLGVAVVDSGAQICDQVASEGLDQGHPQLQKRIKRQLNEQKSCSASCPLHCAWYGTFLHRWYSFMSQTVCCKDSKSVLASASCILKMDEQAGSAKDLVDLGQ